MYITTKGGEIVTENIMEVLTSAAAKITQTLTPNNPQCVIIRILEDDNRNIFKIFWGIPIDSQRHGINNVGHLLEPTPKMAILEAITKDEIVIIDDAMTDPRVNYMHEHVVNKGILSLAVIPISSRRMINWLIIVDKVAPEKKGFTSHQTKSLAKFKVHIEEKVDDLEQTNNSSYLDGLLGEYAHLLLNALSPVGGFAQRIKKSKDLDKIGIYADIIEREVTKAQKEFKSFVELINFAYGNHMKLRKLKISEIIGWWEDLCDIESEYDVLERSILADQTVIKKLISELKNYIEQGASSKDDLFICISEETFDVVIKISSDAFRSFKENTDSRLSLLKEVVRKQSGKMDIREELCILAFPISN
jgi:hypothetical protein